VLLFFAFISEAKGGITGAHFSACFPDTCVDIKSSQSVESLADGSMLFLNSSIRLSPVIKGKMTVTYHGAQATWKPVSGTLLIHRLNALPLVFRSID